MLRDEIELYERLTGKDANSISVAVLGAFLDGYEIGKKESKKESEPKKGKWIRQPKSKTVFFCSKCGREINTSPFTRTDNFPFCHCGADMREG